MGLPAALHAHKKGDLELASRHYQRALDQNGKDAVLFQNYGALLREAGHVDKAKEVYQKGLALHPKHRGIRLNYANLIRRDNPYQSFEIHFLLLREKIYENGLTSLQSNDFAP